VHGGRPGRPPAAGERAGGPAGGHESSVAAEVEPGHRLR